MLRTSLLLVDQRRIHDFGHPIKMRTIHIVFFRMFIRLTFLQVVLACIRRLRSLRILCTPWSVLICRARARITLHEMLKTDRSRSVPGACHLAYITVQKSVSSTQNQHTRAYDGNSNY